MSRRLTSLRGRQHSKPPDVDMLVKIVELLLRQIEAQQEVRDRWFRYYLLITAGSIAFVTSILKVFSQTTPSSVLYMIVATILLLTGSLGYCFFSLYLRQRRNYANHYMLLAKVQETVIETVLKVPYGTFYPSIRPFTQQPRGADYYTLWVQALLASAYFGAAIALIEAMFRTLDMYTIVVGLGGMLLAIVLFNHTRRRYDATIK